MTYDVWWISFKKTCFFVGFSLRYHHPSWKWFQKKKRKNCSFWMNKIWLFCKRRHVEHEHIHIFYQLERSIAWTFQIFFFFSFHNQMSVKYNIGLLKPEHSRFYAFSAVYGDIYFTLLYFIIYLSLPTNTEVSFGVWSKSNETTWKKMLMWWQMVMTNSRHVFRHSFMTF